MLPSFGSNKFFQIFFKIWEIVLSYRSPVAISFLLVITGDVAWMGGEPNLHQCKEKWANPHPRCGPLEPPSSSDSLEAVHSSLLTHLPLCPSSVSPSSKVYNRPFSSVLSSFKCKACRREQHPSFLPFRWNLPWVSPCCLSPCPTFSSSPHQQSP